jgi:hypothetical protein
MYDQVSQLEAGFPPKAWTGAPCTHCGSRDIVSELRYNPDAEVNPLSFSYRAFAPLWGTEEIYADLSRGCGTIIRAFVKNTNRKWNQK